MSTRIPFICVLAAALLGSGLAQAATAPAAAPVPHGDVVKGKATFNQQCMLCHSSVAGQEGAAPSLFGVVMRRAASDPGYPGYSRALKASGLTWTTGNLNSFLSGPAKLVPGTAMPITVNAPQDRANIIAYLASLKGTH